LIIALDLLGILPPASTMALPLLAQQSVLPPVKVSFALETGESKLSRLGLSRGKFLVASRGLTDPNFSKTVVLLVDYDRNGALGLVINRPTEVKLSTVLPDMEKLQQLPDTISIGGPVAQNQILLLLRSHSQPEGARRIFDDVYVSSSRATLQEMIDASGSKNQFRVYAGHAGWSPGQLDREVSMGGWHILQADAATIFEKPPSEIWPDAIRRSAAVWVRLMEQNQHFVLRSVSKPYVRKQYIAH